MSPSKIKPTESELEILQILWKEGPCSVRTVNDEINKIKPDTGYTTTLKHMQIMAEKQLVARDTSQRQHIYAAAIPQERIQVGMVKNMINKFFDGSTSGLIMHALGHENPSDEELKEIKDLIEKLEANKK